MIQWASELDRHIRGQEGEVTWWIRVGRDDRVLALYRIDERGTEKLLPRSSVEESVDGMKEAAEAYSDRWRMANEIERADRLRAGREGPPNPNVHGRGLAQHR